MSQSQIVTVKLADNEKNRKNKDAHKKNSQKLWAHIKTSSGTEVRLFQGVSPATSSNDFGENVVC